MRVSACFRFKSGSARIHVREIAHAFLQGQTDRAEMADLIVYLVSLKGK